MHYESSAKAISLSPVPFQLAGCVPTAQASMCIHMYESTLKHSTIKYRRTAPTYKHKHVVTQYINIGYRCRGA